MAIHAVTLTSCHPNVAGSNLLQGARLMLHIAFQQVTHTTDAAGASTSHQCDVHSSAARKLMSLVPLKLLLVVLQSSHAEKGKKALTCAAATFPEQYQALYSQALNNQASENKQHTPMLHITCFMPQL